jgi:hypothetical protein
MEKSNNSHSSKTELTTKPVKKTKLHKILKIIMWVLIVSGIGVGIYFFIKSLTKSQPIEPNPCGEGVAESCGSTPCCSKKSPKCCGGKCYDPANNNCINETLCPKRQECGNPSLPSRTKKRCDSSSGCVLKNDSYQKYTCCNTNVKGSSCIAGKCLSCGIQKVQACGGINGGSNPICCNDKNKPYCCGEKDPGTGYGGDCCSKEACLCPGESYGQYSIDGTATRNGEKCIDNSLSKCGIGYVPDKDIRHIARDSNGMFCEIGKIYNDGDKLKCCDDTTHTLCCEQGKKCGGTCSITTIDNQYDCINNSTAGKWTSTNFKNKSCCQKDGQCDVKSICYTNSTFKNINSSSTLKGKCSASNDNAAKGQYCIKEDDWESSTFKECSTTNKCDDDSELCTTIYYDSVPINVCSGKCSNDSKLCNSDTDCDTNITCIKTCPNGKKCSDSIKCTGGKPRQCTDDNQCPGHGSISCINVYTNEKSPLIGGTCDYPKIKIGTNSCMNEGCPENNPVTYCGEGQHCNEMSWKDSTGTTHSSGFCSSESDQCSTKGEQLTPQPLGYDDKDYIYYTTQEACDTNCLGTCLNQTVGDDKTTIYKCILNVCTDGETNYITNPDDTPGLYANSTITTTPDNKCSIGDCYLLQNKPHVKYIDPTFDTDGNLTGCVASFNCDNKNEDNPDGMLLDSTDTDFPKVYKETPANPSYSGPYSSSNTETNLGPATYLVNKYPTCGITSGTQYPSENPTENWTGSYFSQC